VKTRTSRQRIRADPSLPDIPNIGEHIYFKPAKRQPRYRRMKGDGGQASGWDLLIAQVNT